MRLGVGVAGIEGGARVERVRLADGSAIAADLVVVVGIGAIPETAGSRRRGSSSTTAWSATRRCATRAPGVVAAGDVARWHHPGYGESHAHRALDQRGRAGRGRGGAPARRPDGATPFAPVPFVWSDQYDLKIQAAGRIAPDDEMFVAHGSLAERRFVALFGRKGRLRGALAINRVRQLMGYRRMLREGASFEEAVAAATARG